MAAARIGLLECDHVNERFRTIGGDYLDMFASLLPELDLVGYDVIGGELPASPDECDGWVATGSRHSVYEELEWVERVQGFVRDVQASGAPFVGICFGHQLLAHALGGRTDHAGRWGVGAHDLAVTEKEPWLVPDATTARLLYMHQDQVVALPEGATVLGRTDHCPHAMIQVGDAMLGMQAHPEFPVEYLTALLEAREERIGHETVAAALASLDARRDEPVAAGWMHRFLTQR